jgi:RNA polymerase sigma-70 factor (ECF subfamily)
VTVPAASESHRRVPDLAEVYRDHHAFVWRSLRRLGVPERELPDATHDLFLAVHRHLGAFDGRHRITTWLYAFCIRVASERRRRASARYEKLEAVDGGGSGGNTEDRHAELSDRRRLLERALNAMSLEQRAVFVLFELEGWDGDELVAALQIPLGTVHSRLRLARAVFHRTLEQQAARSRFEATRSEVK